MQEEHQVDDIKGGCLHKSWVLISAVSHLLYDPSFWVNRSRCGVYARGKPPPPIHAQFSLCSTLEGSPPQSQPSIIRRVRSALSNIIHCAVILLMDGAKPNLLCLSPVCSSIFSACLDIYLYMRMLVDTVVSLVLMCPEPKTRASSCYSCSVSWVIYLKD